MKIIFLIGSFCLIFSGNAQYNLVPNGGFEDVPSCPSYCVTMNCAPPWVNPTEFGTSDLFNLCNSSWVSFINQYQQPHSGNSYAGFYTGEQYVDLPNVYDAMEYIQVELIDTLEQNKYYLVEYYLSLAEFGRYATNNVGVYFSDTAIYRNGIGHEFMLLDYPEQILPFGNPVILDTADNYWYKVQGIYLATGNEKFITIGNFNSDSETTYIKYLAEAVNQNGIGDEAYYFIDDISVIPLDSIPGDFLAHAGPDQTIYIQDSVFIGRKISNLNCNWYELGGGQIASNTSGLYVQPSQTTTYVVEQILGSEISYDTCTVFVEGLGVDEQAKQFIKIYPNPNNGEFEIQLPDVIENTIAVKIIDVFGKVIYAMDQYMEGDRIKVAAIVKSGIYFIEVCDLLSGKIYTEKIIIKN